jgi:hypothetical protein
MLCATEHGRFAAAWHAWRFASGPDRDSSGVADAREDSPNGRPAQGSRHAVSEPTRHRADLRCVHVEGQPRSEARTGLLFHVWKKLDPVTGRAGQREGLARKPETTMRHDLRDGWALSPQAGSLYRRDAVVERGTPNASIVRFRQRGWRLSPSQQRPRCRSRVADSIGGPGMYA